MPKDPNNHISVSKASRNSELQPYFHHETSKEEDRATTPPRTEWEDAVCPICMDHPHNVVLLLCGSHEKGCRPYICDTSRRHSNCLNQFRKTFSRRDGQALRFDTTLDTDISWGGRLTRVDASEVSDSVPQSFSSLAESSAHQGDVRSPSYEMEEEENSIHEANKESLQDSQAWAFDGRYSNDSDGGGGGEGLQEKPLGLLCPLCRADVKGWKVVWPARHHLNSKVRLCAKEGCTFGGSYVELRRHARNAHPLVRPRDVDSERMLAWQRLEEERDLGDILSTLRETSSMPGTLLQGDFSVDDIVLSDVVVEEEEHQEEESFASRRSSWLSNLLLLHIFSPLLANDPARLASNNSILQRHHRMSSIMMYMLQALWDEVEDS